MSNIDINIPIRGDVIPIPLPVEKIVHKVVPHYIPGNKLHTFLPVPTEKIVEVLIPEKIDKTRVIKKENRIPKEYIKTVEVEEVIEKYVDVPRYIYLEEPKTIIRPRFVRSYHELPPVYEKDLPQEESSERFEPT